MRRRSWRAAADRLAVALAVLAAALAAAGGCGETGAARGAAAGAASGSASGASTAAAPPAPLRASGRWFEDLLGRTVILRGFNFSERSKRPPFTGWMREAHFDQLRSFGANAVRLLIIWEAIEPFPDVYDDAYLDDVEQAVRWAAARGMYVILDMHQDQYSRTFGGDGAPDWACTVNPLIPNAPVGFPYNYLNPNVGASFDRFWSDRALREHLSRSWARVARRFRAHANVIGYDTFNEPFAGTRWPPSFEERELSDFHEEVARAIRAEDPDRVIFFEPQIFVGAGLPSSLRRPTFSNAAYAPHYYDPVAEVRAHVGARAYDGGRWRFALAFQLFEMQAAGFGCAWVLGEFGSELRRGGSEEYLRDSYDLFDAHRMSAFYWNYNPEDDLFSPVTSTLAEKPIVRTIVRPYPRAVAGDPTRWRFDPATRRFDLEFAERASGGPGGAAPTEIFVAERHQYPNGFDVRSSDRPGRWRHHYDGAAGVLRIWSDPAERTHTIAIEPR